MPSRSGGGVYSTQSPSFGSSVELTELDFLEESVGLEGLVGLEVLDGLSLLSFVMVFSV